jgi:hypothetical protein
MSNSKVRNEGKPGFFGSVSAKRMNTIDGYEVVPLRVAR